MGTQESQRADCQEDLHGFRFCCKLQQWAERVCRGTEGVLTAGCTDCEGGHGLQLEGVPQHDVAVQPSTGNEAVCPAPVNSPHPLGMALKVLHCNPKEKYTVWLDIKRKTCP